MIVFRTKDNKNFELTSAVVKDSDELKREMEANPQQFESGYTYYPVKFGRGRTLETTTITKAKETILNA